jgi:hypothetical protein
LRLPLVRVTVSCLLSGAIILGLFLIKASKQSQRMSMSVDSATNSEVTAGECMLLSLI